MRLAFRFCVVALLAILLILSSSQSIFAAPVDIYYDDGESDGGWGLAQNDMDAVLFDLPYGSSAPLSTVRAYVAYDLDPPPGYWRVHVTDKNHVELAGSPFDAPVPTTIPGWLDIPVVGITVPDQFFVALEWTSSTDGLGIGYDSDTPNTRSHWLQSGTWIMESSTVMIRAVVDLEQADTATIRVDPQITDVSVGDIFQVTVSINQIESFNPMDDFRFIITWDNTLMEFNGHSVNLVSGWTSEIAGGLGYYIQGDPDTSYFTLHAYGPATSENRYWETFTFKCLRAGSSPLNLPSTVKDADDSSLYPYTYKAYVEGSEEPYAPEFVKGAVNQISQAPSTPYHYVGGEVFSVNKLAVLSPYLALFSIVAVAILVVKRKLT